MVCESPKSSFCSASQSTCSDRAAYDPPQLEGGVGATMGPPTTTGQPLRRARHGIRGDLVLYAVGLGSMLLCSVGPLSTPLPGPTWYVVGLPPLGGGGSPSLPLWCASSMLFFFLCGCS